MKTESMLITVIALTFLASMLMTVLPVSATELTNGSHYDVNFVTKMSFPPAANEILVKYDETVPGLAYVLGSDFRILDNDAGVFDGDCAVLQIPYGMVFDVWCSARGKPSGAMTWGVLQTREDAPAGKPAWHQQGPDDFDLRNYVGCFTLGKFGPQLGPYPITSDGCTILATRWVPQTGSEQFDLILPLYSWNDGINQFPMTPEYYVGTVAFKASSGSLRVDMTLIFGRLSTTYYVTLWHDYNTAAVGYWTIGSLNTDSNGQGSESITYNLSPGTYSLGLDLWTFNGGWQEILSAGSGLYGLQNSIVIP